MTTLQVEEILRRMQSGEPDELSQGLARLVEKKGEAVNALVAALSSQEPLSRWAAACALGEIGGPEAGRPLEDALKDQDPSVRVRAAQSLGRRGSAAGVPILIAALDSDAVMIGHPPELVADYANQVLGSLTGQRFDFDASDPAKRRAAIQRWKDWWEGNRSTFRPSVGRPG